MKEAVAVLQPYIEAEKSGGGTNRGTMVIATVKGDVHDIGKNIVGIVLNCNNYRVIDLGVMVPAELILDTAIAEKADVIGLSGLITPSLEEMSHIAALMEERGFTLPLLVGGATTNPMHTALRIAPAYSGPVAHVADASIAPGFVEKLLNPALREPFAKELALLHEKNRGLLKARRESLEYIPLAEARKHPFRTGEAGYVPAVPRQTGAHELVYAVGDVAPYIDWTYFFHAWEIKGHYPEILDDDVVGAEAKKLLDDARALLRRIQEEKLLTIRGAYGIFPAAASGDDILVYADESRHAVSQKLACLRQQLKKSDGSPYLCHADYLAAAGSGLRDWIGAFAVSAGFGVEEHAAAMTARGDEYGAIMLKVLADRLAEAAAERLHEDVRKHHWGYSADEAFDVSSLLRTAYRGIRPAPGYPPCPDHREKAQIFALLDASKRTGMALTDSFMMVPAASVSGWYFSHPESRYFSVGKLLRDQAADFAARRGESLEETERWLRTELNY